MADTTTATATFNAAVNNVFAKAQATTASMGGLSWIGFGQLLDQLKITAVEAAKDLALQGYQKKQFVLDAIGTFIDTYLPLPPYLFFLRGPIKSLLLKLASGAIETLYEKLVKADPVVVPVPVSVPVPVPAVPVVPVPVNPAIPTPVVP